MTDTANPIGYSIEEVRLLADDLLRALAEHIGDSEEIDTVLARWLDELDYPAFGFVAIAALQATFTDCLSITDPADWPPGGIAFTPANREDTP